MTIDGIKPDQPEGARDNGTGSTQKKADREKWLAELEKKSFQVNDDRLTAKDDQLDPDSPEAVADQPKQKTWLAAAAADGAPPEVAEPAQALQPLVTPGAPAARTPGLPAGFGAPGIDAGATWSQNPSLNFQPAGHRITAQTVQATQRLEVLMNQLKFMEVNIRVTQQGEEVTLWIRDFKQKYAQQAYQWVKDLQALLPQIGQKLTKIVVNGTELVHLNELLGGGKWQ
jgi:hypothetical protein